ncbi:hypothetical protein PRNP1_015015 [Phytophthora ramorum]
MRVPSARRLVTALCVLLLVGKGSQKLRLFVVSILTRLRALTAAGTPATPTWRLFSSFLGDLRDRRVGKVLMAGDHCVVQAKDGVETYKVLVPPRTENTYILDALVQSGVEFGSATPSASSRLVPIALALMPFLYLGLTYKMMRGMFGTDAGTVGKDGTKKVRKQQQMQRISFDDVAGIDVARKELEEVVDFLRHPASEVDLSVVAEECGQLGQRSGAQLASLVNEAALLAVRHGDTSIQHAHFELAMNRAFESQTRSIAGSSFEFTMEGDS